MNSIRGALFGWENSDRAGYLIPVERIPLLLPSGRYSLQILEGESKVFDSIVPDRPSADLARLRAYDASSGADDQIVQVTSLVPRGKAYAAILTFRPIQYQVQSNSAKAYRRIRLQITHDAVLQGGDRVSTLLRGERERTSATTPQLLRKASSDSPLATGVWYRFEVVETGVYALDAKFFLGLGISLSSIGNINSIRLFGNGGEALPEDLNAYRPNGLTEIPRHTLDANGNGQFDDGDFVLFYGKGARGWRYDANAKSFRHYLHPYTEKNYYFLSFGGATNGRRMDSIASLNSTSAYTPSDFQEKLFFEQEQYNLIDSGRRWVGTSFDITDNTKTYTNMLDGLVAGKSLLYRFWFLTRSASVDSFRVTDNDQLVGNAIPTYTVDVSGADNFFDYAYETGEVSVRSTPALSGNRSVLKFRFVTATTESIGWLDYFEIHYRREFSAVGDQLLFSSPDTSAIVEYTVGNLPSDQVYVFDVTKHDSVKLVTQVRTPMSNGSTRIFQASATQGSVRQYAAVGTKALKSPSGAAKVSNSNLHGTSQVADFIIISPKEFLSDANRLKAHRESRDSLKTVVVDVENIYNEFSSGQQDPMALRDFLRFAQQNWSQRRQYVLLFGNGHFDYKNIVSSARNYVPSYQSVESNFQYDSYTSDDHFVFLNPNDQTHVSMALGRLPARSAQEAKTVVDKIIAYETSSVLDSWRNVVTFVADDDYATLSVPDGSERQHTFQTEDLAENHTPPIINRNKIYTAEYPTINAATGRRKPSANEAIIQAINRGSVIINYIGHGNTRLWAHEAIFTKEESLPQLKNADRLTFCVGATCNFGQYDNPNDQSAGEILIAKENGGIGEVTASRTVVSTLNAILNNEFYDNLFRNYPQQPVARLGDAMYLAKQRYNSLNDIKYHLLADPTLRLSFPAGVAKIDSLNGSSTAQAAILKSLGRGKAKGTVRRQDGSVWANFNGTGTLELMDAYRMVAIPGWGFSYVANGSLLYRGQVSVGSGVFSASFPIPKDVSFGNRSRLSFYAADASSRIDVLGTTDSVLIRGTDSLAAVDTTGPKLQLYLNDRGFKWGDVIPKDATLLVDLADENGINTSSVGIGHKLEATLTSTGKSFDLTDYYRSNLDTYQQGSVSYPMSNLPEGRNTVRVKAWDTRNNSASEELFFVVRTDGDDTPLNVMNFPNPFSRQTHITFQRTSTAPIDVELKIYTVAGRLIYKQTFASVSDRFVQIPWEGRDRDGSEVANGVYFYRITTHSADQLITKEATGKLAVVR
ncbi:MAG: type IX secretion system sortase PorU [Ignavibacteriales bacterium]|nr:type IX secretion system sortase PorU [Ignavibacteriales bacterium]